jgi:sugar phosphate isomerase/epimerase
MAQDRRTFLTNLGLAALTAACGRAAASPVLAAAGGKRRLSRIGIQLYTLRRNAQPDLAGTLGQLAKIGYKEIEFAGYYGHAPAEVRSILDANGLTAPSTHVGIDVIEKTPGKLFSESKIVGHEWITVPSLPSGPKATIDDWKRIAAQFNKAALQVKEAGYRFAFHNHNQELRKIGDVVPLDVLIAETDPTLVSYEMDIYWVVNGGGDPIALLAKHPGRFKMLHVKDSMGPPDHKMADVGVGTIDFGKIFAAAKGIEHYFVEHDQPADAFVSAATSYGNLSKVEF